MLKFLATFIFLLSIPSAWAWNNLCYSPVQMAALMSPPKKPISQKGKLRNRIARLEDRIEDKENDLDEAEEKLARSLDKNKLKDKTSRVAGSISNYIEDEQNGWGCVESRQAYFTPSFNFYDLLIPSAYGVGALDTTTGIEVENIPRRKPSAQATCRQKGAPWKWVTDKCICPAPYKQVGNICREKTAMEKSLEECRKKGAPWKWVTDKCICPAPYKQVGNICREKTAMEKSLEECRKKGAPWKWVTDKCICPAPYKQVGNICREKTAMEKSLEECRKKGAPWKWTRNNGCTCPVPYKQVGNICREKTAMEKSLEECRKKGAPWKWTRNEGCVCPFLLRNGRCIPPQIPPSLPPEDSNTQDPVTLNPPDNIPPQEDDPTEVVSPPDITPIPTPIPYPLSPSEDSNTQDPVILHPPDNIPLQEDDPTEVVSPPDTTPIPTPIPYPLSPSEDSNTQDPVILHPPNNIPHQEEDPDSSVPVAALSEREKCAGKGTHWKWKKNKADIYNCICPPRYKIDGNKCREKTDAEKSQEECRKKGGHWKWVNGKCVECPDWKAHKAFKSGGKVASSFCDGYAKNKRNCKNALAEMQRIAKDINDYKEDIEDLEDKLSKPDNSEKKETEASGICLDCLKSALRANRPTAGQSIGGILSLLTGAGISLAGYNLGQSAQMDTNMLRIKQGYESNYDYFALNGATAGFPYMANGIYGMTRTNTPTGGWSCTPSANPYGHHNYQHGQGFNMPYY